MSTARKVSLNTFYQLVAKLTNAISGFIIIGLIIRNLGEQAVGIYTLALTYVSLYFIAVDYGANAYAVKAIRSGTPRVFNKLLAQRLAVAAIVTLIAGIGSYIIPGESYTSEVKTGILIILAVVTVQAVLATSNAVFQEQEKFFNQMLVNIASASIHVLAVIIAIRSGGTLNSLFVSFLIASVSGAATSLLLVKKYTHSLRPIMDKKFNIQLAHQTLPLTISMITNLLYFRIDALIMPLYRGLSEIGQYNIAYRLFENVLTIPTYLGNALYPTMLALRQTKNFYPQMLKILLVSNIVAVVCSLGLIITSPYLVMLINGYSEPQTVAYIRILALGLPFFFTTSLLMWLIITNGKQRALIWIYGINMVMSVSLNMIFIPIYGAYASAWITIGLEALVLIFSIITLKVVK